MGVQEELEELRQQRVASAHAANLTKKGGRALSTPAKEEAALKAEQERVRKTNYGKDADENLKSFNEARALTGASGGGGGGTKVTAESLLGGAGGAGANDDEANDEAAAEPSVRTSKAKTRAKAETLEEDSNDDDVPDLEEQEEGAAAEGAEESGEGKQLNRAEKKARKMMQRLGMRPVSGISRVTFKPNGGRGGGYFAIDSPNVYEKNGSYVIFGEAYHGGQQQAAMQQAAMQQAKAAQVLQDNDGDNMPTLDVSEIGGDDADEAVDDGGVEAKDIELVMSQASCSRAKAVAALKENDGDLVNAIMYLTT